MPEVLRVSGIEYPKLSRDCKGAVTRGHVMRYFITFACYGSHLHGVDSGSVDRNHNVPFTRLVEANPERVEVMRLQMDQAPYLLDKDRLDKDRRVIVLAAIREVCKYRGWSLWAAHVRTNHVHVVVEAVFLPKELCTLSRPTPAAV